MSSPNDSSYNSILHSNLSKRIDATVARKNRLDTDAKKAQINSERILKQIERNTASLNEIVELLHQSNLQQGQITELMGDLFAISKAKNKTEAESLYKKTIRKISSLGNDVNNISTLITLGTNIYNAVIPFLK